MAGAHASVGLVSVRSVGCNGSSISSANEELWTGGFWWKSPVAMTVNPPHGMSGCCLTCLHLKEERYQSSLEIIENSSSRSASIRLQEAMYSSFVSPKVRVFHVNNPTGILSILCSVEPALRRETLCMNAACKVVPSPRKKRIRAREVLEHQVLPVHGPPWRMKCKAGRGPGLLSHENSKTSCIQEATTMSAMDCLMFKFPSDVLSFPSRIHSAALSKARVAERS